MGVSRCVGCGAHDFFALVAASIAGACLPTTRTPDRLYPLPIEIANIRGIESDLVARYYAAPDVDAKRVRNEIVAQRMYAIDLQYTEYEAALTRESQQVGFGALTAAAGLTTASTLVASAATKTVLSAVATAVLGTKSHYESEVLLAQTIRTIQKQMRASRNFIAANIASRINQSTLDYPLPATLSDVEDYYNAGTITTGVIDTSTTVGAKEDDSKILKQEVVQAPAARRAEILRNAVVEDAAVPMVRPIKSPDINPDGLTDFEKRGLTRATIKAMETVICPVPKTGRLTEDFRSRVLDYVRKPATGAITNADANRVLVEADRITNGAKTSTCP